MSYYGNANNGGFYGGGGAFGQQPQQASGDNNNSTPYSDQQQQSYDGTGGGYSQQQQPPAYSAQQWQPHAVQQQQPQSSFPMQQQQPVTFWNPAMATATMAAVAGGNTDAALDLVSSAGKSFLQSKTASMVPGVTTSMQLLRTYFAVDNRYVVRKMKKVLFPFLNKQWKRAELNQNVNAAPYSSNNPQQQQQQQQVLYATPHYSLPVQDENAPDLYIPCMSLITYVLLCALAHGAAGPLDPQVIPSMGTWCLAVQTLEVLAVRVCLYVLSSHPSSSPAATLPVLDLYSYTGYKYLGLCVNLMASLLLGRVLGLLGGAQAYYLSFAWTALATCFFMLKTMANTIPTISSTGSGGPKREIMVLGIAASQLASMWIVSIATKLL